MSTRTHINELAPAARHGDPDATDQLMRMARCYVAAVIAREGWYMQGAEHADMIQEGMIGVIEALRDWDGTGSFSGFMSICVGRQLREAVRIASRRKHQVLSDARSLDAPFARVGADSNADPLIDRLRLVDESGYGRDPAIALTEPDLVAEAFELLGELRQGLSEWEEAMLDRFILGGQSYAAAAAEMGLNPKSADNALQRLRKKLRNGAAALAQTERWQGRAEELLAAASTSRWLIRAVRGSKMKKGA